MPEYSLSQTRDDKLVTLDCPWGGTLGKAPNLAMPRELLVVDLDHTLVKGDLLVEQILVVLRTRPFVLFRAVAALVRQGGNRAVFKDVIASAAEVDVPNLPYRDSVLQLIDSERRRGATIVLASASHHDVVKRIARHLGRFDRVLASTDHNLKGRRKLEAIRQAFPGEPFAYVGDSAADRPIWSECGRAIAVNPSAPLRRWLKSLSVPVVLLRDEAAPVALLLRQLRTHRWTRNLLVFGAIIAAPDVFSAAMRAALAFLAFSCLSSAGYVLNDLADLQADRRDPVKRDRPLASGRLRVRAALTIVAALVLATAVAAAFLPQRFAAALLAYFAMSVAYSFWLRRLLLMDALALASLYTFRVLAGGLAMDVAMSVWLLAFWGLLFFGLALNRRYVEVARAELPDDIHVGAYRPQDQDAMFVIGTASSLLAVLALALGLHDDGLRRLYVSPALLSLLLPLLLYWVSRHWILVHRDESGDRASHTLYDSVSVYVGAVALGVVLVARL